MFIHSILRAGLGFVFFLSTISLPASYAAQNVNLLPTSNRAFAGVQFSSVDVMGLNIHTDNPFRFDFIIDKGHEKLTDMQFKHEAEKLIKYFLASLTIPADEMWVNLSPYEKGRVVPGVFGITEMGKDLLAQDYVLKQLTSTLTDPDQKLGREFWRRVYTKAQELFGMTQIPVDSINKVWILPDKALIYEHEKGAFIVNSHLKVMTEQDYLALRKNKPYDPQRTPALKKMSQISHEVLKQVLLPQIEKEVNEGQLFSGLRQIYHSLLLASWYKKALAQGVLGFEYTDQMKTGGIEIADKKMPAKIYAQYLKAFKRGVYNFIREEPDPMTHEIVPRKYFSGGIPIGQATFRTTDEAGLALTRAAHMNAAMVTWDGDPINGGTVNQAMTSAWQDAQFKPVGFGTSGIRDLVKYLTDREVFITTVGFLRYAMKRRVVEPATSVALACDLRWSSPRISQATARSILTAGLKPQWLGPLPTPALALWGMTHGIPALMVTASHNPSDENGIKHYLPAGELLKPDEKPMLAEAAKVRKEEDALKPTDSSFEVATHMFKDAVNVLSIENRHQEAKALYIHRFDVFKTPEKPLPLAGKKYVVYQHSAVGRDIIVTILQNLGATVIPAYRLPDGEFKAIDTENVKPQDKEFFLKMHSEYPDADAILSLDGDSDRPFVIDEKGNFHRGDILGILGALYLKADFVGLPDSANDAVDGILNSHNIELERTEVGSPYVIAAMNAAIARGKRRVVSWEVNGGFLTGSDFELPGGTLSALPTRDAVLPILMALLTAVEQNRPLSKVFDQIETRFTGGGLKDDYPVAISAKILTALSPKINDETASGYNRQKSVRQVGFRQGAVHVSFFDGRTQILSSEDPEAKEYIDIEVLAKKFLAEKDGLGTIKSIRYVTGVRIEFENGDVVHLRYSKNKVTQFRVYTVADTQARADELSQKAVQPGGIYDQMRGQISLFERVDRAMNGRQEEPSPTGGIDLDEAQLNLRVEKIKQDFRFPTVRIPGLEIKEGLKPRIIKIIPFDIKDSPYLTRSGFSAGALNVTVNNDE